VDDPSDFLVHAGPALYTDITSAKKVQADIRICSPDPQDLGKMKNILLESSVLKKSKKV